MSIDKIPAAGALGELKSKRIPGREDVIEDAPTEPMLIATDTDLTIHDIELLAVLIDACAQRGAFKINEYSVVGTLHAKMAAFIEKHRR